MFVTLEVNLYFDSDGGFSEQGKLEPNRIARQDHSIVPAGTGIMGLNYYPTLKCEATMTQSLLDVSIKIRVFFFRNDRRVLPN
jgi:hypothetical protein